MAAKILIGTPCAGGMVTADFYSAVYQMGQALGQAGAITAPFVTEGDDVADQRDQIAHRFLQTDATHLLFVDSDVAPERDLGVRLLGFSKDLIGVAYPQRHLDLAAFAKLTAEGHSAELARSRAYRFSVQADEAAGGPDQDGLFRPPGVGMGSTLISRGCFDRIIDVRSYPNRFGGAPVRAFFRRIELPDGSLLTEDFSFCHRWRATGGTVYAYSSALTGHVGRMVHRASYADSFQRLRV